MSFLAGRPSVMVVVLVLVLVLVVVVAIFSLLRVHVAVPFVCFCVFLCLLWVLRSVLINANNNETPRVIITTNTQKIIRTKIHDDSQQ